MCRLPDVAGMSEFDFQRLGGLYDYRVKFPEDDPIAKGHDYIVCATSFSQALALLSDKIHRGEMTDSIIAITREGRSRYQPEIWRRLNY